MTGLGNRHAPDGVATLVEGVAGPAFSWAGARRRELRDDGLLIRSQARVGSRLRNERPGSEAPDGAHPSVLWVVSDYGPDNRLKRLSAGAADASDRQQLVQQIIDYVVGAFERGAGRQTSAQEEKI